MDQNNKSGLDFSYPTVGGDQSNIKPNDNTQTTAPATDPATATVANSGQAASVPPTDPNKATPTDVQSVAEAMNEINQNASQAVKKPMTSQDAPTVNAPAEELPVPEEKIMPTENAETPTPNNNAVANDATEEKAASEKKESPIKNLAKKLSSLKKEMVEETVSEKPTEVPEEKTTEIPAPTVNASAEATPTIVEEPIAPAAQTESTETASPETIADAPVIDIQQEAVTPEVNTELPATPDIEPVITEVTPEATVDGTEDSKGDKTVEQLVAEDKEKQLASVDAIAAESAATGDVKTDNNELVDHLVDPATLPATENTEVPASNDVGNQDKPLGDPAATTPETPAPKASGGRYPYTIHQLLELVIERDASDLHITVDYPVMIRVDGALIPVSNEIVTPEQASDLILPVLNEQKKELLEVNREVDLAYAYKQDARFRINAYFQQQTLAAAFRLIPNKIRTLDELKLPPVYHKLASLRQGLVLVTGPTGSGKSTTLAAILQEINMTRPDHLITIEDPIEYVLPKGKAMVDQRELHDDTHSWEIALKSALRQDPDVILVGEMRDYETISSAITLAETGHLVFATLHTNSASQTMDRIIDVFPEHQQSQVRAQLSNVVEAVVAQRLIPLDKGGRMAVSEIMLATPAVRNLVREGKTHQIDNVISTSADIGMVSLEHSLVKLVREGVINMEKAQDYAVHPEEVVRLLKGTQQ